MNIVKNTIKKAIGAISRMYHRIRSLRPIWLSINSVSRFKFSQSKSAMSDEQKRILADLKRDGIAISHIDALCSEGIFKELQDYVMSRWHDKDVRERYERRHEALQGDKLKSKSFFLTDLWRGEHVLDLSNPFTRFSLSEPILNTVNNYLKMWTKFTDWRLQVTVPMPEGMRSYASQEWHRDPEDQQLIKTFLYLNDVDENSGPFIYLRRSHIWGKWRHIFPQKPPRGSAGDDSKIPHHDRIVCTGRAGTIIFCDTSGLHRGGHAKTNNRFMYTSIYESRASVWPVMYRYPNKFNTTLLSSEARYAIKNKIKKEPKYYSW